MRASAALLTPLLAAALAACTTEVPDRVQFIADRCERTVGPDEPGALRIGAILSLMRFGTSPDLDDVANGLAIELAVNQVNERQGIKGRRFHLTICDKAGDSVDDGEETAAEMARWLENTRGVTSIISGGSADTLAIHAAVHNRLDDAAPGALGPLVVARTATSADITHLDDDGLVWRTAPSDLYQGLVMARVLQQEGAKKVAIVAISNSYGDSLAKIVKDNAGDGIDVQHFALTEGGKNLPAVVAAANAQAPDFLVLVTAIGDAKAILEAKDAPALAKARLLLADALHSVDLVNALADKARLVGALGTLPGDPFGPVYKTLQQSFLLAYGADSTQRSYTAHSYDAAMALMFAYAWAIGKDATDIGGAALAEGMRQLSAKAGPVHTLEPTSIVPAISDLLAGKAIDIEGASGPLDFDPVTGEPTSAVEVWRVKGDGSFETLHFVRATPEGDGWQFEEFPPP
jgi:branched-chain amino acid transport system substrate-binding protein